MGRKEYTVTDVMDVMRRYRHGDKVRSIARATGIARNTVKKYLSIAEEKGFTREGPDDLDAIAL